MKNIKVIFLAFALMFSIVFIGEAISSNGNLSVQAQTSSAKKPHRGVIRKTYAGGKYVVRKTWNGTKWVSRKVWVGTKWTGRKTKKIFSKGKRVVY